ncbi:MAG: GGDEF domain-containing phosphodiesterase [Spirochaetales bacterium]|jgi:EAL domain-containing protein (putative c-di-GMP-specific phosphodiesterase class I)
MLPLGIVEISLVLGFIASLRLSRKGIHLLITFILILYPLAYAWGAYAPGNHQAYLIILLLMPAVFDSLAPVRWYWQWCAYATAIVAATLFSFLIGFPSAWIADFSLRVIQIVHVAFVSLWILRYVTRRQMGKYMSELADNIVKDKVTGLPTIVAFRDAFETGQPTFVGLVAVGNFHELSALFGYSVSTEVLSMAASRFLELQPQLGGGKAFRLRDHDFGFLRPMKEGESAQEIATKLLRGLAVPLVFQGKTIELNYRVGYTVIDDGNAERSLDEAEDALAMASRDGLDVAAFAPSLRKVTDAEIAIADLMTLSRNISEKTLAVFYQPVVALASGKIAWNEALVRFKGVAGEYYNEPARFMSLASTTGHWAAIENFMFERTIERACGKGGPVSVNIALKDLNREDFRSAIERGARCAKKAGSVIILEILESELGTLGSSHFDTLKELREKGCLIAIDDFGTGYSNYSRLLTMPVDIIKFDRSMILSARSSKAVTTLVQGLVRFCFDIGALTVAEGIETKDFVEFALDMGFDFGQGYFWSKPVPESEAAMAERTPLLASKFSRFDAEA